MFTTPFKSLKDKDGMREYNQVKFKLALFRELCNGRATVDYAEAKGQFVSEGLTLMDKKNKQNLFRRIKLSQTINLNKGYINVVV